MKGSFSTVAAVAMAVVIFASVCFAAGPVNVNAPDARALMAKKSGLVLVDVRTPEEFQQGHLKGAKLIPLNQLQQRMNEIPRDKPILVYCAVGARSLNAARFLSSQGYRDVYQISDGLVGWYKNGFPIERPAN